MQGNPIYRATASFIVLLASILCFPGTAFPASWDCQVITSSINIPLPSTVVVQRDAAIGQPISDWVTTGSHEIYSCTWYGGGNNYNIIESLTTTNTGETYTENGITYQIHPTNLTGVGIVVQATSESSHSSGPSTYDFPWGNWAGNAGYNFNITATFQASARLIKTANNISGGNITGAQVGTIKTAYQPPTGSYWYTIPVSYGGTRVMVVACSVNTPTLNVPLGDHLTTEFTGVGYTTTPKEVPISLDCNAGARINVMVQATPDPNSYQQGSIRLLPGGATGIAVQLMDKYGYGVRLNQRFLVGTASSMGQYNFNWTARYLQTNATVTTGDAVTMATLTLNYE